MENDKNIVKFEELYSLDVNKYVETKAAGGSALKYLSWAYAVKEFTRVYPDYKYKILPIESDKDLGYMVHTEITAGGRTCEMWLPVMDGANKAMKAERYKYQTKYGEKWVEAATMFDVNKALMRCLVKNMAMFGLGLYIYAGEDIPEDIKEYSCAVCGKPFEPVKDRSGKYWNAGQIYHIAISEGKKKGITDGLARCSACLNKELAKKSSKVISDAKESGIEVNKED